MKKFLMVVLALALVAGMSVAAFAEVQNVKVSGDITVLGVDRMLDLRGDRNIAGDANLGTATEVQTRYDFLATITRVKVDADLTDNVATTVRLLNERYWGTETGNTGASGVNSDIALDLAFVTLKEFLYSPLTLTIGRQEIQFGNGMIVGDPDTNNAADAASPFSTANGAVPGLERDPDLSARKAFDAIRATLNYDPLVIDAFVSKISERNLNQNDDTNLYGINAGYKVGGRYNVFTEGYWFQRNVGSRNFRNNFAALPAVGGFRSKKADITNVVGGRLVVMPHSRITTQIEAAYQFGQYTPVSATGTTAETTVARRAWALETAATLDLSGKVRYAPSLTALYSYFSGDHENNAYVTTRGAFRGWDPMFENQKYGDIANALFNQTNVHLIGGILTAKATEDVKLKAEYYAYWWARAFPAALQNNPYALSNGVTGTVRNAAGTTQGLLMTGSRFAGQEIDVTATYDYTEDVQFGLMGGVFFPGGSFDKGNNTPAKEVIGSMKVTF